VSSRAATRMALGVVGACAAMTLASLILVGPLPGGANLPGALSILVYRLNPLGLAPLGALVASRRPAHPIGWLMLGSATGLALEALSQSYANYGLEAAHPLTGADWAAWIQSWVWTVSFICLFATLLLFPTGTLISRRWRAGAFAAVIGGVVLTAGLAFVPGPMADYANLENPVGLRGPAGDALALVVPFPLLLVLPVLLVASASSVLIRFWRSRGLERQQLKWLGFSIALVALALPLSISGWLGSWGDLIGNLTLACIPISIATAVLRYRLYEIDRIINRTLVYGLLTLGLGATYWGSVALLQQALRPFTQGSDLAIVASTLAVAALFQPLRKRIQDVVDRRFYLRRYDAARTLEAFSAHLREEVDLDNLSAELTRVVRQTIEPTRVDVWLRH
jgi:hypothetical protein